MSSSGEFKRDATYIPDRITRDGRRPDRGPVDGELWPVEPGRYRLVAAKACPWATRAIIVRQLLGLEDVISLGTPGPVHDERSWTFDLDPGGVDPVLGIERLQQAYFARFPDYPKGITVPAIVDVPSGGVVTNDFPWITHDFFFEWREFHRADAPDLWPTLARFDAVYHGHFKCNRQTLTEMPNLWGYARELYAMPAFGDNTDFEQIKTHYYVVHQTVNPTQIVPAGPDPAVWLEPHGRG